MDNHTLIKVLNSHPLTKNYFQGVFSFDEIPWKQAQKIKTKSFYIFNLDKSNEPGSHWICIMLSPLCKNFYFDSYGNPPHANFQKFMKFCYCYNSTKLQHDFSTSCGQWCLYFIYHMSIGLPFNLILQKFNKGNKLKNDYLITHIVKRIFKTTQIKPVSRLFLLKQLCKPMQTSQPIRQI